MVYRALSLNLVVLFSNLDELKSHLIATRFKTNGNFLKRVFLCREKKILIHIGNIGINIWDEWKANQCKPKQIYCNHMEEKKEDITIEAKRTRQVKYLTIDAICTQITFGYSFVFVLELDAQVFVCIKFNFLVEKKLGETEEITRIYLSITRFVQYILILYIFPPFRSAIQSHCDLSVLNSEPCYVLFIVDDRKFYAIFVRFHSLSSDQLYLGIVIHKDHSDFLESFDSRTIFTLIVLVSFSSKRWRDEMKKNPVLSYKDESFLIFRVVFFFQKIHSILWWTEMWHRDFMFVFISLWFFVFFQHLQQNIEQMMAQKIEMEKKNIQEKTKNDQIQYGRSYVKIDSKNKHKL